MMFGKHSCDQKPKPIFCQNESSYDNSVSNDFL